MDKMFELIRKHAIFAQSNKKTHILIVAIYLLWMPINSFLLLETENLIWAATLVIYFWGIIFFSVAQTIKPNISTIKKRRVTTP